MSRSSRKRGLEAEFFAQLEGAFAGLADLGYEVSDRAYSEESFGNGLLTFQGPRLEVRVVRDRSQHFVDIWVRGEPEARASYQRLRETLGHPPLQRLADLAPEALAQNVLEDLSGIEHLMSPSNFRETVAACRRRQAEWELEALGRPCPTDLS